VRSRYAQAGGSKLFEFVIVLILLGILAVVVLEYMLHYIEVAEKSAMETTVMYLRSALRLRLAEVLVENDIMQAESLTKDNPMDWLQDKPYNYAGTFDTPPPSAILPGKWYFDTKSRELVYLVEHGREFVPDKDGLKRVRLQVKAPSLEKALKENRQLYVSEVVREVSLAQVTPYVWEFK
jgi:type II secretory pathway pseudopilin PulG